MDKQGNHIDRILKIGTKQDGTIACRLAQAIIGRIELAEILGVKNRLDFIIMAAQIGLSINIIS